MESDEERHGGIASLSRPGRIVVATAMAAVTVAVGVHLGMVFLHVAPENTLSSNYGETIDEYVYPEFEQNWKLFAPNPLQQNVAVHARAEIAKGDGSTGTTGWVDLSAMDAGNIRGNFFPSHAVQNELRRAWDFYTGSHDAENEPTGLRGRLSQQYMERIVMKRFGTELNGGTVERIQLRSATTPVAPPSWSAEKVDTKTEYRVLPWWQVDRTDLPGGGTQ